MVWVLVFTPLTCASTVTLGAAEPVTTALQVTTPEVSVQMPLNGAEPILSFTPVGRVLPAGSVKVQLTTEFAARLAPPQFGAIEAMFAAVNGDVTGGVPAKTTLTKVLMNFIP